MATTLHNIKVDAYLNRIVLKMSSSKYFLQILEIDLFIKDSIADKF